MILLFLLLSSMIITGALSNGGMMGSEKIAGNSWMWIPTGLTLGLIFMIGWVIFSKKRKNLLTI